MIDLEERFRANVQQLPQAMQLDPVVDADVLVAAGHRLRRARLLKRTAAAGALMTASAMLGWAGLNTAATRWSDPVVVGNPAPAPPSAAALVSPTLLVGFVPHRFEPLPSGLPLAGGMSRNSLGDLLPVNQVHDARGRLVSDGGRLASDATTSGKRKRPVGVQASGAGILLDGGFA